MAEFTLPKNSVLIEGKTFKAPAGATNIRRFEVYRWDPESGENPRIDAFELDMDSWFTINPETVAIIRALKEKGRRLLILSNMNVEGRERMYGSARILDGEDWLSLFDDVLLSCDLGLIKPEPEIYLACIARSGAEPGECLFIDDVLANIEGARACGMMAVHFTDARLLASVLADEYGAL